MSDIENPKQVTQTQIIKKIENLIDTNSGDIGRLYHILECLKQSKPLYHSDQMYLENKIKGQFIIVDEDSPKENPLLSKIQTLIDSGVGDPGRLQYMYDKVSQNKPLFHSDQVYLENKLKSSTDNLKNNSENFENLSVDDNIIEQESKNNEITPNIVSNTTQYQLPKLRGTMPKGWNPPENKSDELTGLYEKIKTEEESLKEHKKIHSEIEIQRSKLAQLILNRKEYENQVSLEKSLLDSQIKEEHLKIQEQTKLSEQIILQKAEIEKVKTERNELMKKITIEKEQVAKELEYQKNQLSQIRTEQEEIEKQIKIERLSLSKMLEEQKVNLQKQSQINLEIKEKQVDLEKTKKNTMKFYLK
ncbi:hypothetical protein [Candidatus Nitrosarchaeum limnium]|uniref:Uncharacterized protein n=1 Tax=Candidatus Nitrosarchaeum limnium BG20 TaxID=859192 RepID=S2E877_9ARCH|nr:hypothetical protein [Candidatus Nitrosarchaeum limnium]EPA05601.1 hypothetical protein BG20_I1066 [Candidatus Nitrosarchaeum limnium BG20]